MANKFFAMGLLMMRFMLIPSFIYQDDLEWKNTFTSGTTCGRKQRIFLGDTLLDAQTGWVQLKSANFMPA